MNRSCVKTVKWMTGLSICSILIGIFLPFITWDDWWEWFDANSMSLLEVIEETERVEAAIVMGISLFVTLIAVCSFGESKSLTASVFMLLAAIVGGISLNQYKEQIGYFFSVKGAGASIIEVAYVVLAIAAVIALIVDIYSLCSSKVNNVELPKADEYACPNCGKTLSEESKFCGSCGFDMRSYCCPNCGTKRNRQEQFCSECGKRLPIMKKNILDNTLEESEDHWICSRCGEKNYIKLRQCQKCGMNWN